MKYWTIRRLVVVLCLVLVLVACQKQPTWQEQYDLGMRYLSESNYEEAILAFTAAIEIDPNRAEAYICRGKAYMNLGESDEHLSLALTDYLTALNLGVDDPTVYLKIVGVYMLQGDRDSAVETIDYALSLPVASDSIRYSLQEIKNSLMNQENSSEEDMLNENLLEDETMLSRQNEPFLEDILSDRMHLVTDQLFGGVYNSTQVHPEKHVLILGYWFDKGADTKVAMIDRNGNILVTGYQDSLWFTETGYARIKYCYADSEIEAAHKDVQDIAMGNIEGCAWVEAYDWEGSLIGYEPLGDYWREWNVKAGNLFPSVYFSDTSSIDVTWETGKNGFSFKDANGTELGQIMIENPDELDVIIMDHFVLISKYFECQRVYWID